MNQEDIAIISATEIKNKSLKRAERREVYDLIMQYVKSNNLSKDVYKKELSANGKDFNFIIDGRYLPIEIHVEILRISGYTC